MAYIMSPIPSTPPTGPPPASSALSGATQSAQPQRLYTWIEGGEASELNKKVMDDVGKTFQEFKEQLVAKLIKDATTKTPWDENTINIDINLKTKKVEVQLKSDLTKKFTIDLRSMVKSPENSALFDTVIRIEQCLRDHKFLTETKEDPLREDNDDDIYKYELSPRTGESGISKAVSGLSSKDVLKEWMGNPPDAKKNLLRDQLVESNCGRLNKTNVKDAIEATMKAQTAIISGNLKLLKRKLDALEKQQESTDIGEQGEKDVKLLKEQIKEYENVQKGLLHLVLTLRELMNNVLPNSSNMDEQAERVYDAIIKEFERNDHIGYPVVEKGKAEHLILKGHEKLAAVIAAAVVFSHTIVPNDSSAPKEYARHYQDGYQRFLSKHQIDPNTHLGVIGSLLRLHTVDQITQKPGIKDTEIRSLVNTKGMTQALADEINTEVKKIYNAAENLAVSSVHIGTMPPPQSGAAVAGPASAAVSLTAVPPVPVRSLTSTPRTRSGVARPPAGPPPLVARPPAGPPPVVQGQRVASAAQIANGTVVLDPSFGTMRDEVVNINKRSIGQINGHPIIRTVPVVVKVQRNRDGSLGVGASIKARSQGAKIGYGIAANSGLPWGDSGSLLVGKSSLHMTVPEMGTKQVRTQEESCVNLFLKTECERIENLSYSDQQNEVQFYHDQAQKFYKNNPHKKCAYDIGAVERFINRNSDSIVNKADGYLQLKKLLFAAYAKDRWGMKDPVGDTRDKNAFFGKGAVDYTQGPDANVYSRSFAHPLGIVSDDQFIYASVANANDRYGSAQGSMKRTLNTKAVDDYAYFRETVKYALIGQLRLAAETGCTDFVAARLGTGVYAGKFKPDRKTGHTPSVGQNIIDDFPAILDEALDVTVTVGSKEVPLRQLFESVTIADVLNSP